MADSRTLKPNPSSGSGFVGPASVLLGVLGLVWVLYAANPGLIRDHFGAIGAVLGVIVYLVTMVDPRLGLIAIIMAIGVSPEFNIAGIPNFRLEDFLIPVVVVVWATRLLDRRSTFKDYPLRLPLLAVVVTWSLSLLYGVTVGSVNFVRSILFLSKYLEYFLLMVLVHQNLNSEEEINFTAMAMIIVSLLVGAQGAGAALSGPGPGGEPAFVEGPGGETRNVLGGYFVFHVLLCFGIALFYNDLRWRILMILAVIFLGIPISMTFSRTSYIALFAASGMFLLLKRPRLIPPFIVLLVILPAIVSEPVRERAATILEVFGDRPPASWADRVGAWKQLLGYRFLSSPLFGYGPGSIVPAEADNEYIFVLINSGLLGLGAFIWLLVSIFRCVLRILDQADAMEPFSRAYAMGFLAGFMGCVIHAISAPTLTAIRTAEMFYLATGILLAVHDRVSALGFSNSRAPGVNRQAGIVVRPAVRERFFPI